MSVSIQERFWNKVDKTTSGCWEWKGWTNEIGYGMFWDNRNVRAHRFSYEMFKGKIPGGLGIDHLCRNRKCVNPEHLEAVTQKENVRRGILGETKRDWFKKITHCPKGHPYDGENTYYYRYPGYVARNCRTCHRERQRRGNYGQN